MSRTKTVLVALVAIVLVVAIQEWRIRAATSSARAELERQYRARITELETNEKAKAAHVDVLTKREGQILARLDGLSRQVGVLEERRRSDAAAVRSANDLAAVLKTAPADVVVAQSAQRGYRIIPMWKEPTP